ncbi:hypothetical protein HanXRQr2_Chr03g0087101 [Helianthus annuus]|uniref:Uncharacterized protein n=1 Tax=Helianthus annuus TaxID=4232 RepID=A0A9K3JDN8_HELAN|nr:hypothetical protein HanXRQr2_Chr03g0087101 [Helianthus annuus]
MPELHRRFHRNPRSSYQRATFVFLSSSHRKRYSCRRKTDTLQAARMSEAGCRRHFSLSFPNLPFSL